jgi:fatty-acyl-CoA synthase
MGNPPLILRDLFSGIGRFGRKPAVLFDGATLSYEDLARQSSALAAYLYTRGVGAGTPVALAMSNCPEFIIADQALIKLGAAKVPVNDMLSAQEIRYILDDSGSRLVIADAVMYEHIDETASDVGREIILTVSRTSGGRNVAALGDALRQGAALAAASELDRVRPAGDDLGMILYTGGTTGRQKGVVHTQAGLSANMLAHVIEMCLGDDERLLVSTPLPHAAGLIAQAGLLRGATIYLERGFSADGAIDMIEEHGITFVFMVPTMIYRLLDRAQARDAALASIKTILYGAAPMSRPRLDQGLRMLGPVFMQLYGQSEAPDFLTRLTREDHIADDSQRLSSCGRRALLMDVAIVDDDDQRLPAGAVGEVVARGPYIMRGYHNMKEESQKALRGGWLHTGDVGWMDDDGYLYIVDRLKDMIISGGMNVYSTEVEQAVQRCDAVAHVAVVGVPHPDWGEAVVAFVVPAAGEGFSQARVTATCRELLAVYKRPKRIVVVQEFPLTPYGKVDKKALRAMVDFAEVAGE